MLEWRPGLHLVQLWLRSTPVAEEYVPAGQFLQFDSATPREVLLHFPAPHSSHFVLSTFAYLPAPQSLQVSPAVVLTWPAAQSLQTRAPMSPDICLPASQTLHTVWPVSVFVYLPDAQFVQLIFLDSALNVSRWQSSQSLDLSFPLFTENVPGGQALQSEADSIPVAAENLPASQNSHAVLSFSLTVDPARPCCPAGHSTQLVASFWLAAS
jgi:hypothetical protein